MSFLRRVAGHSLRDRVRSSAIREELGVEPVEVARASIPDVPWTPSSGGVPGTSNQEEAQDTLEGPCLSAGLGTPWAPPRGAVWGEGRLGVSAESAAPATRSRTSGRRRSGEVKIEERCSAPIKIQQEPMDPAPAPMQNDCESGSSSVWSWWPSWCPTSMSLLKTTESKILACVKNDLWARFVTLPNQDRIWTLSLTNKRTPKSAEQAPKTPLVMVHGFGGGVGLWIRNLDALSRSRTVYAFDLLGFGRSSRPNFPSDAAKAEEQFVNSIEQWRQAVGLDNMILLGHSLGGYLATSYAIQHPS
ncbi:hypothetical protein CHARACLAT_027986, partial [Characodon lateralis]|nr:hypothetical protein [Characodon lateralis]